MSTISNIKEAEEKIIKPQIYVKMAEIMGEITSIGKSGRNPQQGYNFRGIDQVYNALHPLLAKHGVFITFSVGETSREERPTKNGGVWIYTMARVTYRFTCSDGSFVETLSIGEGADSGDKSLNKALSAAQKYAFLQMFCIPTEELKDSEIDSPEFTEAPKQGLISEAQRKRLFAISKKSGLPDELIKESLLREFGYSSSKDILKKDYEKICDYFESFKS